VCPRSSSSGLPPNLRLPRGATPPRRRDLPCPQNCSTSSWTAALATCRTTRARTADHSPTAFRVASLSRPQTPCPRPAPAPPFGRWCTTGAATGRPAPASPVPCSCGRPPLAKSRRRRLPTATVAAAAPPTTTPGVLPAPTRAVGIQPFPRTPTSTPTGECPCLIDFLSRLVRLLASEKSIGFGGCRAPLENRRCFF